MNCQSLQDHRPRSRPWSGGVLLNRDCLENSIGAEVSFPGRTLLVSIAVGDECLNSLLGVLDCVHRCAKNEPLGRCQFAMEADFVHGAVQPQHQIVDVVGVGQKKTA